MLTQQLWLSLQYLAHRQEAEVLEVLVGVLDEEVEFGDAELHGGGVMVEASDHRTDALVEQRHGRGAVDEVGKGLHQLLPKPRLQWSEGAKLMDIRKRVWLTGRSGHTSITHQFDDLDEHPVVGGVGHEFEEDGC